MSTQIPNDRDKPTLEQRTALKRVLITDECRLTRTMLVYSLAFSGYEVDAYYNGEEAVEEFKRAKNENRPYDIVVLDAGETSLKKDFVKGKDVLPKLREIDPLIPAILTIFDFSQEIDLYLQEHGFTSAVYKPNNVVEKIIQEIWRLSHRQTSPVFRRSKDLTYFHHHKSQTRYT